MPDRNSWYTIQRNYWGKALEKYKESPVNSNLNVRNNQHDGFWFKNEHFYLETEDKNILLSSDTWLNDRIMDAAQALSFKTLGTQEHYKSVFNCQKRVKPYKAVTQEQA